MPRLSAGPQATATAAQPVWASSVSPRRPDPTAAHNNLDSVVGVGMDERARKRKPPVPVAAIATTHQGSASVLPVSGSHDSSPPYFDAVPMVAADSSLALVVRAREQTAAPSSSYALVPLSARPQPNVQLAETNATAGAFSAREASTLPPLGGPRVAPTTTAAQRKDQRQQHRDAHLRQLAARRYHPEDDGATAVDPEGDCKLALALPAIGKMSADFASAAASAIPPLRGGSPDVSSTAALLTVWPSTATKNNRPALLIHLEKLVAEHQAVLEGTHHEGPVRPWAFKNRPPRVPHDVTAMASSSGGGGATTLVAASPMARDLTLSSLAALGVHTTVWPSEGDFECLSRSHLRLGLLSTCLVAMRHGFRAYTHVMKRLEDVVDGAGKDLEHAQKVNDWLQELSASLATHVRDAQSNVQQTEAQQAASLQYLRTENERLRQVYVADPAAQKREIQRLEALLERNRVRIETFDLLEDNLNTQLAQRSLKISSLEADVEALTKDGERLTRQVELEKSARNQLAVNFECELRDKDIVLEGLRADLARANQRMLDMQAAMRQMDERLLSVLTAGTGGGSASGGAHTAQADFSALGAYLTSAAHRAAVGGGGAAAAGVFATLGSASLTLGSASLTGGSASTSSRPPWDPNRAEFDWTPLCNNKGIEMYTTDELGQPVTHLSEMPLPERIRHMVGLWRKCQRQLKLADEAASALAPRPVYLYLPSHWVVDPKRSDAAATREDSAAEGRLASPPAAVEGSPLALQPQRAAQARGVRLNEFTHGAIGASGPMLSHSTEILFHPLTAGGPSASQSVNLGSTDVPVAEAATAAVANGSTSASSAATATTNFTGVPTYLIWRGHGAVTGHVMQRSDLAMHLRAFFNLQRACLASNPTASFDACFQAFLTLQNVHDPSRRISFAYSFLYAVRSLATPELNGGGGGPDSPSLVFAGIPSAQSHSARRSAAAPEESLRLESTLLDAQVFVAMMCGSLAVNAVDMCDRWLTELKLFMVRTLGTKHTSMSRQALNTFLKRAIPWLLTDDFAAVLRAADATTLAFSAHGYEPNNVFDEDRAVVPLLRHLFYRNAAGFRAAMCEAFGRVNSGSGIHALITSIVSGVKAAVAAATAGIKLSHPSCAPAPPAAVNGAGLGGSMSFSASPPAPSDTGTATLRRTTSGRVASTASSAATASSSTANTVTSLTVNLPTSQQVHGALTKLLDKRLWLTFADACMLLRALDPLMCPEITLINLLGWAVPATSAWSVAGHAEHATTAPSGSQATTDGGALPRVATEAEDARANAPLRGPPAPVERPGTPSGDQAAATHDSRKDDNPHHDREEEQAADDEDEDLFVHIACGLQPNVSGLITANCGVGAASSGFGSELAAKLDRRVRQIRAHFLDAPVDRLLLLQSIRQHTLIRCTPGVLWPTIIHADLITEANVPTVRRVVTPMAKSQRGGGGPSSPKSFRSASRTALAAASMRRAPNGGLSSPTATAK